MAGSHTAACRTCGCYTGGIYSAGVIYPASVTYRERTLLIECGVLATRYRAAHVAVVRTRTSSVAERAVRMVMMPVVAVCPIAVVRPAVPTVPPVRVIAPVPRRCPTSPERIPEPIIYIRTVDIYRLDHIVLAIHIFVTYHLRADLSGGRIFLHIDRRYILKYILCQYGLDNYQMFVVGTGLNNA